MSTNRLLSTHTMDNRSSGLDFIRGLLAAWVVVAHLVPWAHIVSDNAESNAFDDALAILRKFFQSAGETHPAVLGFIVLSGYCIHRSGARFNDPFNFKKYAIRRFFRILPVYILAVIFGVVAFGKATGISKTLAATLSGTASISEMCLLVKLTGVSAFFPNLHTCSFQGNAPLTTAMVEIWLYVLYGICIFRMQRGTLEKHIAIILLSSYSLALAFASLNPTSIGWWHNGSFFSFAIYWWIGAYSVNDCALVEKNLPKILGIWIALTALILLFKTDLLIVIELRKLIFATIFGYLTRKIDNSDLMIYKLLRPIGLAGYSIYALHAPILIYMLITTKSIALSIGSVALISTLSYLIFEKPLIKLGKYLSIHLRD
jgi:peptidoglycan/LPS O-acetylase OafA/YrhL